jgi:hypothetical protein
MHKLPIKCKFVSKESGEDLWKIKKSEI